MVIKKGVIKGVPKDMELENMMHQRNLDNRNKHPLPFQFFEAVRLKLRDKEKNEETEEQS
jgi:hypothetical protein